MKKTFKIFAVLASCLFALLLFTTLWAWRDLERYNTLTPEQRAQEDLADRTALEVRLSAQAKRNLAEHRDGRHCLGTSSGQHEELADFVAVNLREPASFEHLSTNIFPVDGAGNHNLVMRYRARNGFGGMTIETVRATIKNSDCSFSIDNFARD